jgi:ABC-type nitrate/sulfonate/bicarbonate transport system substrate-binding protein
MRTLARNSLVFISAVLVVLVALAWWFGALPSRALRSYSGPVEKITISSSLDAKSALLYIAQHNGLFADHGLEVTLKFFPSGKMALEHLQAGKADVANFADFVLVNQVFAGNKSLRCVGAIAAADDHYLIVSKERGIPAPENLRGKRIGATRGTSAEFFLGRFLAFNNLGFNEVEVIDVNPVEQEEALATGRVDAVMTWERWAEELKKNLAGKVDSWPGQSGQKYYWVLAATYQFLKARPEALDRLFRALKQAEIFIKRQPEDSVEIIARQVGLNPAAVKGDLTRSKYGLSFDQSLLIIMEDEARWMIKNHLTGQTRVPDFLGYMHVRALARVAPDAVRMIVPSYQK